MSPTLGSLIPPASRRTQLLLAALMWTAVGVLLPTMGLVWDVQGYGLLGLLFAVPFFAVGLLKSKILDRISEGTIAHIRSREADAPFIGFLPLRSWALIGLMMAGGATLRHFFAVGPTRAWLGFVYIAVGSALLISSRKLWRARRDQPA
jgi:hypothetical protein